MDYIEIEILIPPLSHKFSVILHVICNINFADTFLFCWIIGSSVRNSGGSMADDQSLSRSASDLSVSAENKPSAPATPLPSHPGSVSPP